MDRQPYTYVVLRYRHDPLAGEVVNVGVLLHAPKSGFLSAQLRKTYGRLSRLYPDFDGTALTSLLKRVETAVRRLAESEMPKGQLDFTPLGTGAAALGLKVMNDPAGLLLWGEEGSGTSLDPGATLSKLYDRFVGRFDVAQQAKRSDADVWRRTREALLDRDIPAHLAPKTIRSAEDEVTFDHAWKNGVWHVLQPLSFDLADADSIKDKAARWVGHMYGLRLSPEHFRPYFIVGEPTEKGLDAAFERAVTFLLNAPAPGGARVFRESELPKLVAELGDEIAAHQATDGEHLSAYPN